MKIVAPLFSRMRLPDESVLRDDPGLSLESGFVTVFQGVAGTRFAFVKYWIFKVAFPVL